MDTRCCRYSVSRGNNKIQKQWAAVVPRYGNSSVHRQTSRFPRQPLWSARFLATIVGLSCIVQDVAEEVVSPVYADVLLLFFLSRFLFFLTGKGTGRIFRLLVQFVDRNYRNYRVCIYSRSGTTFEWEDRDLKIYVGMYKEEFLSPLFFSLSLFLTFSKEVITYPRIFEISIYILFPFLY